MKKSLFLLALPALMILSGCNNNSGSGMSRATKVFAEDCFAHEEIFGKNNKVNEFNLTKKGTADISAPKMGYQIQYDAENDKLAIRFLAAIKDVNITADWTRGVAAGDGTQTLALSSNHQSTKYYTTLVNGNNTIEAGEGKYVGYAAFVVYTLYDIPYEKNKDSYLLAYLTIADAEDGSKTFTTSACAVKIEKNNDNTESTNVFSVPVNHSGVDGYFLQGTFNGETDIKYAVNNDGDFGAFKNIEMKSTDSFGFFRLKSDTFQYFSHSNYFEKSLGHFNESTLGGYNKPYYDGTYSLYISNDDNEWWHINTYLEDFADVQVDLYLKAGLWDADGARFAVYMYKDENTSTWEDLTKDGDYYVLKDYDYSHYPYMIFCRMNGSNKVNNWNNKRNQTSDLNFRNGGLHSAYEITGWDKSGHFIGR